jgi:hypothetical protein
MPCFTYGRAFCPIWIEFGRGDVFTELLSDSGLNDNRRMECAAILLTSWKFNYARCVIYVTSEVKNALVNLLYTACKLIYLEK